MTGLPSLGIVDFFASADDRVNGDSDFFRIGSGKVKVQQGFDKGQVDNKIISDGIVYDIMPGAMQIAPKIVMLLPFRYRQVYSYFASMAHILILLNNFLRAHHKKAGDSGTKKRGPCCQKRHPPVHKTSLKVKVWRFHRRGRGKGRQACGTLAEVKEKAAV
jgi:hypothetical protein